MADPPTPRLPGQPPPLPSRFTDQQLNAPGQPFDPRMAEPFPPAEERAPDTLRLGSPLPRATILPPPPDPLTEGTAALLRQELALVREVLRENLPTLPALPMPAPPVSARTRSRAAVAALGAGKYGAAVALGVPTLLRIVAKAWPATAPVILPLLEALGV